MAMRLSIRNRLESDPNNWNWAPGGSSAFDSTYTTDLLQKKKKEEGRRKKEERRKKNRSKTADGNASLARVPLFSSSVHLPSISLIKTPSRRFGSGNRYRGAKVHSAHTCEVLEHTRHEEIETAHCNHFFLCCASAER